jgi:hypothetical protein
MSKIIGKIQSSTSSALSSVSEKKYNQAMYYSDSDVLKNTTVKEHGCTVTINCDKMKQLIEVVKTFKAKTKDDRIKESLAVGLPELQSAIAGIQADNVSALSVANEANKKFNIVMEKAGNDSVVELTDIDVKVIVPIKYNNVTGETGDDIKAMIDALKKDKKGIVTEKVINGKITYIDIKKKIINVTYGEKGSVTIPVNKLCVINNPFDCAKP